MVVYICHPKLHRRLRWRGLQFQVSLGKKVFKTPSQWEKAGHGGMNLSSQLQYQLKIRFGPVWAGQKARLYL
jgi:hypothetical protein